MKKKTKAKRKYVKTTTAPKPVNHKLKIDGPCPDFSGIKIMKNTGVPKARGSFYWDHLINKLDEGDSFRLPRKEAGGLAVRARKLGYVVVLAKWDDENTSVWFGGLKK